MELTNQISSNVSADSITAWFDQLINSISVDKMMMQTKTAPKEKEKFYLDAINEDQNATNNFMRVQSTKYFITELLTDYFSELSSFKSQPQRLAFDLSEAKILVWAQIKNEDESTEDALLLSEARANFKYNNFGFYVSSTIVEEGDCLQIPSHYHELKLDGRVSGAH